MTTEYFANGSFSDHTHAVCIQLTRVWRLGTSHPLDERKFEFLMVKLLRVYGERLGARSR